MTLELNDKKVLPDGIHDADLEEIREVFGQFQRSNRRNTLCGKLADYLDELKQAGIAEAVIVDGSFIMGCIDEPDDIDIILVLAENWDMTQNLRPFQYNLVSKKDVKRNFPIDLILVRSGSAEEAYWVSFFSKVNIKWYDEYGFPDGSTKGLVRISL